MTEYEMVPIAVAEFSLPEAETRRAHLVKLVLPFLGGVRKAVAQDPDPDSRRRNRALLDVKEAETTATIAALTKRLRGLA